jgi:hypothetical protein
VACATDPYGSIVAFLDLMGVANKSNKPSRIGPFGNTGVGAQYYHKIYLKESGSNDVLRGGRLL